MPKLRHPSGKAVALKPVHPNVGLTVGYRQRLDKLIERMQRSICYWLTAQYRANPPKLAQDASPAADLIREMRSLGTRWMKRFEEGAQRLGEYFATSVQKRSDAVLKKILKDSGFAIKFKMTRTMNDVMQATIGAQVGLIRSIASEHLSDVQQLVMRSVQEGRDLGALTQALETRYGITRRRASLIARDQNNKATASMTRVRYQELGITQAIWMHSGGGKEPRPTHVKNSGNLYDVAEGWLDPAVNERVWPGTLINCRCVSRPVVSGV
jgi:SPP1 gp7 family putative phage head morphogenesis protein